MYPENWRHADYPKSLGRYKEPTAQAMILAIKEMNLHDYVQVNHDSKWQDEEYTEFVMLKFRNGGLDDFWKLVEQIKNP